MKRVIAFLVLMALILAVPGKRAYDQQVRPFYQGHVTIDPPARTITAQLDYLIPYVDDQQVVFNVFANAYRDGIRGNHVFPELKTKAYPFGDSVGRVEISSVLVNGQQANFMLDGTILRVDLPTLLPRHKSVRIEMGYKALIPATAHRNGANQQAVWAGHWLPILAVREESQWLTYPYYPAGDPFYTQVADYNLTIAAPPGVKIVTTGQVRQGPSLVEGVTYAVEAYQVRELAIAASAHYTTTSRLHHDGVAFNFHSYGVPQALIDRLLGDLAAAYDFFSAEIGLYPYPELHIVQMSFFLGGMEYPQLIMLGDNILSTYERARSTMIHELAHQWFYAILGNNQVTEPWIDEGLSTFFQQRYLQGDNLTAYFEWQRTELKNRLTTLSDGGLGRDLSIYPTWNSYYIVNYQRSALMQYDLFRLMGEERYRQFTRMLYKRHKFGELKRQIIVQLASEVYGADLTDWFSQWFN